MNKIKLIKYLKVLNKIYKNYQKECEVIKILYCTNSKEEKVRLNELERDYWYDIRRCFFTYGIEENVIFSPTKKKWIIK